MAAMELRGSLNLSKFYTAPNKPKYYGKALIEGVEYQIKGWEKEGPKGVWISLLFEDPAEARKRNENEFAPVPKEKPAPNWKDLDDDIPF